MFMVTTESYAEINTRFKGAHNWEGVPEGHPHEHLRNLHRHLFHVTVRIQQFHDDRDVEYLEALDMLDAFIGEAYPTWPTGKSCEMMCQWIMEYCVNTFVVKVMEDGENGAVLCGKAKT
jgi:hypothetical protein